MENHKESLSIYLGHTLPLRPKMALSVKSYVNGLYIMLVNNKDNGV